MRRLSLLLALAPGLWLLGCSDSGFSLSADKASDTGAYGGAADEGDGGAGGGGPGGSGGADTADINLGGEQEDDFLRLLPAATDKYVFVANPARNTVTRIGSTSLEVITVEVGANPAVVQTTPDYQRAATFNQDSDDVSIIDAATLNVETVPVRENFNNMVMSPDGRWVICYHDQAIDEQTNGSGGVSSYNEISLVDLEGAIHLPQVVGFQPVQIKYSGDSSLAVVVSDENLAVIDLTVEEPVPVLVQIAEDLGNPPAAEEVVITPDGSYALVRQYGVNELVVVDLRTLSVQRVAAGDNPTDLDLSPDGDFAVVVARSSKELHVFDIASFTGASAATGPGGPGGPGGPDTGDTGGLDTAVEDTGGEDTGGDTGGAAFPTDASLVLSLPEDEIIGSLLFAPSGDKAILYTTASLEARYHVWDLATDDIAVHLLEKPIRSMSISPTGESMLVFHTEADADDADPASPFFGEEALTIIDLDDFRSNPLLLEDKPKAYANSNDGRWGYFVMEDLPWLIAIEYSTLLFEPVQLFSEAVHVGVMPDTSYAYVNQTHDLGRISFYEPDEEILETITGFELNAGIEHE